MELKIQVPDRMAIGGDTSTRIGTSGNSKELDDNDALWTLRRIAGAMPKAHYMQFTQTFFLEPIFLSCKIGSGRNIHHCQLVYVWIYVSVSQYLLERMKDRLDCVGRLAR